MTEFDRFYRANYLRMVRYCISCGFNEADVEEEISDVIYKHYEEYLSKIEKPNGDSTVRGWLNRRAMLNLKSRYKKYENSKVDPIGEDGSRILHFDDPESIVELKQRLPHIPPILLRYEAHAGKGSEQKSVNKSTDKSYFCREKKKFLTTLQGAL